MESAKQIIGRDSFNFLKHFQLRSKGGILKVLFTAHHGMVGFKNWGR